MGKPNAAQQLQSISSLLVSDLSLPISLITNTFFFFILFRFLIRAERLRRRKLTPLADLGTLEVEEDGDGDEDGGDAAEQGAGPLHAHALEHVRREEREAGAAERAEEGVCRDGRSSELKKDSQSV